MKYSKVNRTYTTVKRFSWLLVPVIALGGLVWPKLGLLLVPIMLSLMILGFFRGKYWCGNICPHASLFDHVLLPFAPMGKIPRLFRSNWFKYAFFGFFMVMFSLRVRGAVAHWGTYDFWDKLGLVFALNYLMPTVIGVAFALLINPRTWCTFCPMGMMQEVMYWVGKVTKLNKATDQKVNISDESKCKECGRCSMVCPLQLEPYKDWDDNGEFSNSACIRCSVCVQNCPLTLLSMGRNEKTPERVKERTIAS